MADTIGGRRRGASEEACFLEHGFNEKIMSVISIHVNSAKGILNLETAYPEKMKMMAAKMNMPKTLKEFGVDEAEFLEKLSFIAEGAVADPCTGTNPRPIDAKTMEALFKATYYGEDVNF